MTVTAGQRLRIDDILFVSQSPAHWDPALRYVAQLAREYDADTHVLHTNRSESLGRGFIKLLASHSFERGWRDLGPGRLAREAFPADGGVGPRLKQIVTDADVDLVLLGWTEESDVQRATIVEEVLAASNAPVLVLGPAIQDVGALRSEPATIVHATDFSPHATAAVLHALSWAQEYQSWLTMLHSVEGVSPWTAPERARIEETFRTWMEELIEDQIPVWCETEHLVHFGDPARAIIGTAREQDADLIVLGRAGLDGVSDVRPGSTTMKVVREAPCPVLVVSDAVAQRESLPDTGDRRTAAFPIAA